MSSEKKIIENQIKIRTSIENLEHHFREKKSILILDNFGQRNLKKYGYHCEMITIFFG